VYNINQGFNAAMLEKCEALGGYSAFVSKVWEYRQTMALEDAMKAAIRYCIENGILRPFLETHSSEVQNMLITEWNLEEAQQAWLAQGRDEGRSEGRNEGRSEGRNEGRSEGKEQARKEMLDFIAKGYTLEDIRRELSAAVRK